MPENPRPTPSPAASGEFNFTDSAPDRPRLKRRNLKAPTTPKIGESLTSNDPQPDAPRASTAAPSGVIPPRATAGIPAATRPASSSVSSAATPSQPSKPGLYYSTGAHQKKEEPIPAPTMKPSTPASSSPASSASAPASSFRPIGTASLPNRAASVSDFRANIDRQSREQKSVGGILEIVVYVLIGFFVLSACLAAYGAYTLSRQIHEQSVTMNDLNTRYDAQNKTLAAAIAASDENLTLAQAQIHHQQEQLLRDQDTITKLVSANDNTVAALRQERSTRAGETASLRARVHTLETQPRFGQ
jgi:hypothetical protein